MAGFIQVFNSLKQLPKEQLAEVSAKAKEEGDEVTGKVAEAIEQGYTNMYYHGSKQDITEFKPSESGTLGEGVYLESDPAKASGYALRDSGSKASLDNAAVYPVLVKGEPDKTFASEVLVKDPSRIRSINATFDELNAKSKNILAGTAGTAILANEDVEASETAQEALGVKVEQAIKDGAQPSKVFQSLQESGYNLDKIQQALGPAVKPKVEVMRADGVPEDEILGIMQSIGIIPQAPYSDPTAEIDNVIGMQGPGQNKAVTEATDDIKPLFDPDEEVQLVERLTPAEKLDAEAEMPKINPDLSPEELVTNLRNITADYEQMGKELVGWSGLSNKYKFEVKQNKERVNNLIINELQKAGIDAVGVNEYGEVLVRNEETGEPEPIEESILDSIIASKYEIGGAIAGSIALARVGFAVGGPWGAVGGGIIGSIGAATGRGADVINAARDVQYELTTRELLAKMADAGAADAVIGVVGGSAFQLVKGLWKTGKAAGRGLAKGWDLFGRGNKDGAMQAMIDNLGLSQDQAVEIIKRWEKLNDTKVLTKQARDTGKLAMDDADTVLRVLSETTPGAEQMVRAAAEKSRYGGSKLSKAIAKRADDIVKQAENATNDNIGTVVRENLDEHTAKVRDYFENVKTLGSESMKETGYRFRFDTTTMIKKMREQAKGIHNAALRRDFYSYVDRIRELGNADAMKIIGKQAKQFEQAKGLKNVKPKITPDALEKANPYRDFNNLLELRKTVNKLRSDSRFKEFVQFQQMDTAMKGIDSEIARAAREYMPNGETWLRQWQMANTEYSKLKNLESNFLYKMITKGTATPEAIVKSMAKYAGAESPETFMQVMGKLPGETRKAMEGAVYKHLVQNNTIGFEGGLQALNFPQLAKQLDNLAFTQPEVRNMKRLVKEFAEVYKNDPHLLSAAGNMPLPKFQAYLTADPVVRLKYEIASQTFNWAKSRIPFSTNAGRAAIMQNLAKVLDNPLDATSVNKILKKLGNDPELKTKLHELAIQYSKFGYPEDYGKVPVYRVAKPGGFNKASDTSIGRGVLFYTDKSKAKQIASETGAKLQEIKLTHKTIATPEDVGRILGYQPTKTDLQDPEIISKIKQGGWLGVAMDDKVVKFK